MCMYMYMYVYSCLLFVWHVHVGMTSYPYLLFLADSISRAGQHSCGMLLLILPCVCVAYHPINHCQYIHSKQHVYICMHALPWGFSSSVVYKSICLECRGYWVRVPAGSRFFIGDFQSLHSVDNIMYVCMYMYVGTSAFHCLCHRGFEHLPYIHTTPQICSQSIKLED